MQAPRLDDVKRRYLVACPACSASNGVNATECWQCEQTLPRGLPVASLSPPGPAIEPQEEPPMVSGPASFFPVLREELGEPAANDDPALHADTAPDRPDSSRRRMTGAWVIAGAASLAVFLGSGPQPGSEPGPLGDIEPPAAVNVDASARRGELPATLAVAPPPAATRTTAASAALANAMEQPPAPPPVDAPCTPQVAALGLCTPARR
ncbi:hypothetical protein BURC_03589 [Burkholderiaceae bacterium]|nr:hypothetical protein BURC_03589 [Burkholderiaceae bacterium]